MWWNWRVTDAATAPPQPESPAGGGQQRVTPLELFFDLVFVLSFTQVTAAMADDPSWQGVGEGMLVLAAVWWAWVGYSWLTNAVDSNENLNRVVMLAAMGAMLLVSLAIPGAFGEQGILFGLAYFAVRVLQVALYVLNGRRGRAFDNLDAFLRLTPALLLGSALIAVGGFLDGGARVSIWIVAVLIDYSGPLISGARGFNVSPGHFAERHGLIIIIALGESLVAIGAGAGAEISGGETIAALLGISAVAALWWAYFDIVAIVAERRLAEASGSERGTLARDSYSYIHLFLVAGVVLFALGLKKTLGDVDEPLKAVPAVALCGGLALYLLAHVAFRERNVGTLNRQRTLAALVLAALIPLTLEADALWALLAVTAVLVALIAYESIRFRGVRERVRANDPAKPLAEMLGRPLG